MPRPQASHRFWPTPQGFITLRRRCQRFGSRKPVVKMTFFGRSSRHAGNRRTAGPFLYAGMATVRGKEIRTWDETEPDASRSSERGSTNRQKQNPERCHKAIRRRLGFPIDSPQIRLVSVPASCAEIPPSPHNHDRQPPDQQVPDAGDQTHNSDVGIAAPHATRHFHIRGQCDSQRDQRHNDGEHNVGRPCRWRSDLVADSHSANRCRCGETAARTNGRLVGNKRTAQLAG